MQQSGVHHTKHLFLDIRIISILIVLFLISCDRTECKNTNHIFNQFTPDKEIKNLHYWLDKPIVVNGKQLVEVYIQGHGLCAKGQLFVADKAKQRGLESYGSEGYHGAELRNVDIRIQKDSAGTNFILEQVNKNHRLIIFLT